jgi:hypothetical protein
VRDYLRGFVEGNLTIDPTSWHAKMYNYWRPKARFKTVAYRENLCHYVRVVLFWAPLMWVRRGRIVKLPVWAYLVAMATGALIWAGLTYWTDATVEVLIGIGVFLLIVGVVVGVILVYDKNSKRAKKVAAVATAPLWGPVYLLIAGAIMLYERHEAGFDRFGRWFITANVRTIIRPWTVLIAMGLTAWGVFDIGSLAEFVATAAVFLGVIGGAVGVVMFVDYLLEHRKEKRLSSVQSEPSPPRMPRRAFTGVVGTVRVAGHYAVAKKKGVCPFITFDDGQSSAA